MEDLTEEEKKVLTVILSTFHAMQYQLSSFKLNITDWDLVIDGNCIYNIADKLGLKI